MHYVYDFDGTLFASHRLYTAWIDALAAQEIPSERLEAEASRLVETAQFTLQNHVEALGIADKAAKKVVTGFQKAIRERATTLVFDDVVPFLESNEGNGQSILTFGHPDFQNEKIMVSGVSDFIDDIRIANPERSKVAHLREIIDLGGDSVIFIDDDPRQLEEVSESGLPVTLYRMVREGERHAKPHASDDDRWVCISSFEELMENED